ncbi:MAG: NnrS family protein, partial [Leptospirales bacterium]
MIQQPFRVFFTVGIPGMWFALLLWLPGNTARAYSWHGELMIGLFLLPVACGFLLYMVPRFFSSVRAGVVDVWFSLAACLCMFLAALLDLYGPYLIAKTILLAFIIYFFMRRYPAPKSKPRPIYTPFLLAAFFLGLSGSVAQVADYFQFVRGFAGADLQAQVANYGRIAFRHGFFWVLFSGLGIRLFPMLTLCVHDPKMPAWRSRLVFNPRVWQAAAWSLAGTFVLEALFEERRPVLVVRFLVTAFIAGEGWLLFKASRRRGVV